MVIRGRGRHAVHGRLGQGRFVAAGKVPGKDFGCVAAPGTQNAYTYNVDSFAMFKSRTRPTRRRSRIWRSRLSPAFQEVFNLNKGSIPVRAGVSLDKFDACAKLSAADFAATAEERRPRAVDRARHGGVACGRRRDEGRDLQLLERRPDHAGRGRWTGWSPPRRSSEAAAMTHKGACHCGAVRLTLPSTPEVTTSCNCSLCRRIGGPVGLLRVRNGGHRRASRIDRGLRPGQQDAAHDPMQALRLRHPLGAARRRGRRADMARISATSTPAHRLRPRSPFRRRRHLDVHRQVNGGPAA